MLSVTFWVPLTGPTWNWEDCWAQNSRSCSSSSLVLTLCFIIHLCSIPEAPLTDVAKDISSQQAPQDLALSSGQNVRIWVYWESENGYVNQELVLQGGKNQKSCWTGEDAILFYLLRKIALFFPYVHAFNINPCLCFAWLFDVKSFVILKLKFCESTNWICKCPVAIILLELKLYT